MPPPSHTEEKCVDIHMLMQRVQRLEDALPRDDLGNPAFDWHREYHADKIESNKAMREAIKNYQQEVTKNIIRLVMGGIIAAIGTGYSNELVEILKAFLP